MSAERKPLTGRPKIGQRVLVRKRYPGNTHAGRDYWEPGNVRRMIAARGRYAADHPDFDPQRHDLISEPRSDDWHDPDAFEITGHRDKDPQIEAILARCCCHPDKPRGHS